MDCVLFIDDDENDHDLCKRLFERTNLAESLEPFTSPTRALEFVMRPGICPVDLLLIDVNMPQLSGIEFLEICAQDLETPVANQILVMLTIPLLDADRQRLLELDLPIEFANKPLTEEDLLSAAAKVQER